MLLLLIMATMMVHLSPHGKQHCLHPSAWYMIFFDLYAVSPARDVPHEKRHRGTRPPARDRGLPARERGLPAFYKNVLQMEPEPVARLWTQ